MNPWLTFWTLMLVIAGGSFAAITIVVTVRGFRDLRQWFASLSRQASAAPEEEVGHSAGAGDGVEVEAIE